MEAKTSQIGRYLYNFDSHVPLSQIKKVFGMNRGPAWTYIMRMCHYGWIIKLKEGNKIYLRLTEKGKETIRNIYTYYYGPNWFEETSR